MSESLTRTRLFYQIGITKVNNMTVFFSVVMYLTVDIWTKLIIRNAKYAIVNLCLLNGVRVSFAEQC